MKERVKENCVCGSVHEGDNWTIRGWRTEHTAEHAERVIQMQKAVPYLPPYLEPYKITYGDQYGWPVYNPVTCGLNPFEKQNIEDAKEELASEAVANTMRLLFENAENRVGG